MTNERLTRRLRDLKQEAQDNPAPALAKHNVHDPSMSPITSPASSASSMYHTRPLTSNGQYLPSPYINTALLPAGQAVPGSTHLPMGYSIPVYDENPSVYGMGVPQSVGTGPSSGMAYSAPGQGSTKEDDPGEGSKKKKVLSFHRVASLHLIACRRSAMLQKIPSMCVSHVVVRTLPSGGRLVHSTHCNTMWLTPRRDRWVRRRCAMPAG